MSSTERKDPVLNSQQVLYIRIIIVMIVVSILVIWAYIGFYSIKKSSTKEEKEDIPVMSDSVVYRKGQLTVFSERVKLNSYPDTLYFHDSILVVVKPYETKSQIFDISEKKKIRTMDGIFIDYIADNVLFQKGSATFFNSIDLGVLCEKGFIVSANQVLCIVKVDPNGIANKLVSINPITRKVTDVYSSPRVLTAVSIFNGNIYIGEFDFATGKSYLTIDGVTIEAPDTVNIIYSNKKSIYVGSFPGKFNNDTPSYAVLTKKNGVYNFATVKKGMIVLFE